MSEKFKNRVENKDVIIEDFVTLDDEKLVEAYSLCYLTNNGVIRKDILKRLLVEENGLIFDDELLDKIVVSNGGKIVMNEYYTIIDTDDDEMINVLIDTKEEFEEYKVFDFLYDKDFEQQMVKELESYMTNNTNISSIDIDQIIFLVLFLLKYDIFEEKSFDEILNTEEINVNKKDFNELIKIICCYKGDVGVWIYNGYSLNEVNELFEKMKKDCVCCG